MRNGESIKCKNTCPTSIPNKNTANLTKKKPGTSTSVSSIVWTSLTAKKRIASRVELTFAGNVLGNKEHYMLMAIPTMSKNRRRLTQV